MFLPFKRLKITSDGSEISSKCGSNKTGIHLKFDYNWSSYEKKFTCNFILCVYHSNDDMVIRINSFFATCRLPSFITETCYIFTLLSFLFLYIHLLRYIHISFFYTYLHFLFLRTLKINETFLVWRTFLKRVLISLSVLNS